MRTLWIFALFIAVIGAAAVYPAEAQDAILLPLNETVTGTIDDTAGVTYTFEVPLSQDIVLAYDSDFTVWYRYAVTTITLEGEVTEETPPPVGGGGDSPTSRLVLIPGQTPDTEEAPENASRTIEFTLLRPLPDAAPYTLTAYALDAVPLENAVTTQIEPEEDVPVQVFAVETDFLQAFTAQMEEPGADGAFMWVAHVPAEADTDASLNQTDTRLIPPAQVDFASVDDEEAGISRMQLLYAGGTSFRILVEADDAYNLSYSLLSSNVLARSQPQTLTLSYQSPVRLLTFDAAGEEAVTLNFEVTDGSGAFVTLYETNLVSASYITRMHLGDGSPNPNSQDAPLSRTMSAPVVEDGNMTLVVQVPFRFRRSSISVDVEWLDN